MGKHSAVTANGANNHPPQPHAASHKSAGADVIKLNELGAPTEAVGMNSQKLTSLADGAATGDSVHFGQLASSSVRGLESSADKQLFDRLFNFSNASTASYEIDDFEAGGVATTGAAAIPTNDTFGKLNWRVSSSGGAASAVTLVTTGQSSQHKGVVQIDVGTGAGALIGILRSATATTQMTFGSNQIFEWDWLFQLPTLSDGTNTYVFRAGFLQSTGATLTDGVYFEYSSAAPASGNIIGRVMKGSAAVSASGGSSVAAVGGQWHHGRVTWDGTTVTFFVDNTNVGTCASTDVPTAAVSEAVGLLRSAGSTARTALVDRFRALYQWTTSRAG